MAINPYQPIMAIQPPNVAQQINDFAAYLEDSRAAQELIQMQQQKMQQAQEAQAAAQQAEMQYQNDVQSYFKSPTQMGMAQLMAKYPTQYKALSESLGAVNQSNKDNEFNFGFNVSNALENGNLDVAKNLLQERVDAARNSGEPSPALENILKQIDENPSMATGNINQFLAVLDPEKYKKFVDARVAKATEAASVQKPYMELKTAAIGQQLTGAQISKTEAEAQKAQIEARYAEPKIIGDLEKQGWDIKKIKSDIDYQKDQGRIALMNSQLARESNSLKRQELGLKIQEMQSQREEKLRDKTATVTSARADIDNFLNTADRALNTPKGVIESATGTIGSKIFTLSQDTADFEELINTLGSQTFMAQIPKMQGTGALSEGEGAKLQASLQNLSLRQSPERLMTNLKEAQRLLLKARKNLTTKYGIPETIPDTPAAANSSDIDALVKKYTSGGN